MSVDSQTPILEQDKQTPEESVKEVQEMLTETTEEINSSNTDLRAKYQADEMYQSSEDWESNAGLTLGAVPLHKEHELSKPERFAYGAQVLKKQHNIDVTKIAEITVDGIGDSSAIEAQYNVHIDYEESTGVQYTIDRNSTNAQNLEEQNQAQSDLQYVENIFGTITDKFNREEPSWTYGQNRAKMIADD